MPLIMQSQLCSGRKSVRSKGRIINGYNISNVHIKQRTSSIEIHRIGWDITKKKLFLSIFTFWGNLFKP